MTGVDKVPALANRVISGGRLNVAKALAKLLGRPEPPAPAEPACEWWLPAAPAVRAVPAAHIAGTSRARL